MLQQGLQDAPANSLAALPGCHVHRPKRIPYHRTSAPSRDRSQPSQKAVLKCAHDEVIFSLRTKPGFQFFEPKPHVVCALNDGVAETVWIGAGVASVRLPGNGF